METMLQKRDQATSDGVRASVEWWNVLSRTWGIWWTRNAGDAAVAAAASRRTTELIEFARAKSAFYRDAWKALPSGGISLQDLPVVTKRELMR